jgi:hypothetical protein
VARTETTSRRVWSHGRSWLVLGFVLAGYWWLYEQCVRMPRVSLRNWSWPYYAVSLPTRTAGEYRLPDEAAEWFFWPAFQLDRRLHPARWADVNPKESLALVFRNGQATPHRVPDRELSRN